MRWIYLLFAIALFFCTAMRPQGPSKKAKAVFHNQLTELIETLGTLEQSLTTEASKEVIQKQYAQSRIAFKSIEFLIASLDPLLYEKTLNESPLPKVEPNVANKEKHEPKGWQVLDESLYTENLDRAACMQLLEQLIDNLKEFQAFSQQAYLHDAFMIDAIKAQLMRNFTLGITGFDTPGSGLALADLKASHQGILKFLELYQDVFPKEALNKLKTVLSIHLKTDFDGFDRYAYLVEHMIPALEELENIRTSLALETIEESSPQPLAFKSTFENPFQPDFLNASYFSEVPKKEYNQARSALGKKLFNDPYLSKNLKTSCQSCHAKEFAFSDAKAKSLANDGRSHLSRNAPSLNYSIFSSEYFHDLRAANLHMQFEHVVRNEQEFDSDYMELVDKIKADANYKKEFEICYEEYPAAVSKTTIHHALSCYLMSLPTFDSEFDQYVQQKKKAIPEEIRLGFNLFMGKAQCGTCHFPPTFAGLVPPHFEESESEVLGVLVNEDFKHPQLDQDEGRQASGVVKYDFDFYKYAFKTPSIRNVELTTPYMHNGSLSTLEKVVEFYDLGGGLGMGVDLPHQTLPADALNLSEEEKQALIAFMKSLTDQAYLVKH
jgi:cytochrome c peroxidase